MATKFRALYQRRKGRDLFDLWHVLHDLNPDDELIVAVLNQYMESDVFSCPEFLRNLDEKLDNQDFISDLDQLVVRAPGGYNAVAAANLVVERLASRLRNSPGQNGLADGAWRS